jgi:hypothetical protein
MEQRPLRLGDIVDDYCPRERRITNHAIVAIVEDNVRQTRCTTCDAEHVYKEGREPRRRRKEPEPVPVAASPPEPLARPVLPRPVVTASASADPQAQAVGSPEPAPEAAGGPGTDESLPAADDAWPAHRQLIRATLPRTDGEPPVPRPIPEFTMHQRQGRGGGFRPDRNWNGHGNGPERGNGFRQGRMAHGNGRGPNPGNSQAHGQGQGGQPTGRPGGRRRRGRHKPPG